MDYQQYLDLIAEANTEDVTVARRTEIFTMLTEDYKETLDSVGALKSQTEKQTEQINDLTHSHALMFRKLGITVTQSEEEAKKKDFAQTITLEDLEGGK